MRAAILGFVGGAAWLQTRPTLPDQAVLVLGLAAAIVVCLVRLPKHYSPVVKYGSLVSSAATLGFCWAGLMAQSALAPQLPKIDEGRDITLICTIDSLPNRFSQGVRFNFAIESVIGTKAVLPRRVALSWYSGFRGEVVEIGDVQPGQRWQLNVRLQRPHGNANPYGFDYEVWLLEQGLRATGYVRPDRDAQRKNQRLDQFVFSCRNLVEHARATLRERILRSLEGKEYAGVIVALVVGDQRAVEQSDWMVFRRTGISHLISISGLHITMIAGLFALLASSLWRRSFFTGMQLPLLLPAQKVAALTGVVVALAYVLLAGFGVPAQRTLYMLVVVAAALWLGRITNVSHVLCAALGVVVLLDPWAVLWPGFWLSFGAVALILFATVGRTTVRRDPELPELSPSRAQRFWMTAKLGAHTQYVVTLGLVPLTMLLFGQVSLVSPISNAFAIPLISFIVTPLALLGSLLPAPLSDALLAIAHLTVQGLALGLHWLSGFEFAVWSAPTPSWWVFAWALLGTLWLLAPRGWPQRWLGLAAWAPLLAGLPTHPRQGELWLTTFDVGQGMALLIETSGHRLLYDSGPSYAPESNGGNRVIVPYLKARGISSVDGMIVTHSDTDHAGGALSVMEDTRVGWLASSLRPDHPIVKAAPQHRRCEAGQAWSWDGVQFEMLHPLAASYDHAQLSPNARSCTLKITVGSHAILLAGDIEAAQEAELIDRSRGKLAATVLLAPHHGSGTSSTPDFLAAVHPELALFQVGYRNRYHHPKTEVYERYGLQGIKRLRTDESGAIELQFGATLDYEQYRTEHARYWYAH